VKLKVVFIASLSHSGSTLLNLLLGNHPNLIGLGEIDTILHMTPSRLESEKVMRCSCGERVATCRFWAPAVSALLAHPHASLRQRYSILFDTFQNIYGGDYQIVDASKYIHALRLVSAMPEIDLKVVHLIKDVRGFVVSHRDATDAEMKYRHLPVIGSTRFSRWLYLHTNKTPTYLFWKWYLRNTAVTRLLDSSSIKNVRIGYDELAQHPAEILQQIFRFLEVPPPNDSATIPRQTNSHVFMGNPMLADQEKMGVVRYDDRWKSRQDWWVTSKLFPHIMRFNNNVVYAKTMHTPAS
jgi:hypothetical protein